MDTFTTQHLETWIEYTVHLDQQHGTRAMMTAFVSEYPELLQTHSWPEIRTLAERRHTLIFS